MTQGTRPPFQGSRAKPALGALTSLMILLGLALGLSEGLGAQDSAGGGNGAGGRVVLLGFDGADWRTTEAMMDRGELPNLARLREMGTAGPLISTNPAESAAGWAAINTGTNPAKNGVPSFIKRSIAGTFVAADVAHIRSKEWEGNGGSGEGSSLVSRIFSTLDGLPAIPLAIAALLVSLVIFRVVLRAHIGVAGLLAVALGAGTYFAAKAPSAGAGLGKVPGVWESAVEKEGFWNIAARGGAPTVSLQTPLALGQKGEPGTRTLFGLGQPDVRQSMNGDWFVYTTDTLAAGRPPRGDSRTSSSGTGFIFRVDFEESEESDSRVIDTYVYGPLNYVKLSETQAEYDECVALQNDTKRFSKLGFQGSRELTKRKNKLEKTLGEMSSDPNKSKLHLHRTSAPLRVVEKAASEEYEVTIGETTQSLSTGQWSDFFPVRFKMSPTVETSAVTRVRVVNTEPFELYVDTLQYDPKHPTPWQPTSEPAGFAPELVDLVGSRFETLGWGCMTNQVKDKMVDPKFFLEDVEFTMKYRRKLLEKMLEDEEWRVLYSVFSATDRVQHMMYGDYDREHPMHDPERASTKVTFFGEEVALSETIPAIYRQMDEVVGETLDSLQEGDTLMLCADHGFNSYRRGMNVNNWLESEGFLVLRDDLSSPGEGAALGYVDWSRTKAYSLGLGMIYLNLEGREPEGIVPVADADSVMADICDRFLAARDGGRVVGSSAVVVKDLYQGPEAWGSAAYPCSDIMLGFAKYYRSSWTTVIGSIDLTRDEGRAVVVGDVYEDNDKPWTGDHASNDPELVSGIFFSSEKVLSEDGAFSVMDIAPTVLDRVGVEVPDYFDRAPLQAAQ